MQFLDFCGWRCHPDPCVIVARGAIVSGYRLSAFKSQLAPTETGIALIDLPPNRELGRIQSDFYVGWRQSAVLLKFG
jgi:hypothetical protein